MSEYYLIGTKYENSPGRWEDMFPEMVHQGGVSVGFAGKRSLAYLYGKDPADIHRSLKASGESVSSCAAMRKFLNIRAGDWIALKGVGAPLGKKARLTIVGYAVAVERDGQIYRFEPKRLRHVINTEFIETDIEKTLSLGYGQTVHHLTMPSHIKAIFGPYQHAQVAVAIGPKGGTQKKNLKRIQVSGAKSYVTSAIHNRLQQSLFEHLRKKHGSHAVTMEMCFVDITLVEKSGTTLFEVKPYSTAKQCIREALGQLLEYGWFVHGTQSVPLRIVVVGRCKPNIEETAYLEYLKRILPCSFDYLHWPL